MKVAQDMQLDNLEHVTDRNVEEVKADIAQQLAALSASGKTRLWFMEAKCLMNPQRRNDGTYRFFNSKYHDVCGDCNGLGTVGLWFLKKPCATCDGAGWFENVLRHTANH